MTEYEHDYEQQLHDAESWQKLDRKRVNSEKTEAFFFILFILGILAFAAYGIYLYNH